MLVNNPTLGSTRKDCCNTASATHCAAQGVNMTALREIKLLKELDSPYIVRLLDVFPHKRNLSLVRSTLRCGKAIFSGSHTPSRKSVLLTCLSAVYAC